MSIQAISSIASKGYSNISFGKRGEKSAKNTHMASPLKSVPLAVLVAMSPLNTTNAENIMRSERNQNVIELAQNPQNKNYEVIAQKEFPINGFEPNAKAVVKVIAKDDKKFLTLSYSNDNVNDAKFQDMKITELQNVNAYIKSSNGVSEGPLSFSQVKYRMRGDSPKEFTISDANVYNYVDMMNKVFSDDDNPMVQTKNYKTFYSPMGLVLTNKPAMPWDDLKGISRKWSPIIKVLGEDIQGSYDTYTINLRGDGSGDNYVTVKGAKGPEVMLDAVYKIHGQLITSLDEIAELDWYQMVFEDEYAITDDKLGEFLENLDVITKGIYMHKGIMPLFLKSASLIVIGDKGQILDSKSNWKEINELIM